MCTGRRFFGERLFYGEIDMRKWIIAAGLVLAVGAAAFVAKAHAGSCFTTCNGYGSYQSCMTTCL